jgi:hypothetical protein
LWVLLAAWRQNHHFVKAIRKAQRTDLPLNVQYRDGISIELVILPTVVPVGGLGAGAAQAISRIERFHTAVRGHRNSQVPAGSTGEFGVTAAIATRAAPSTSFRKWMTASMANPIRS